jgi:hypothetical protein
MSEKKGARFPIHESDILKSSKLFDTAMKPEWAAARTDPRIVDLTNEKPEVFTVYIHWLYLKTLPTVDTENFETSREYTHSLANVTSWAKKSWMLASRTQRWLRSQMLGKITR